MGTINTGIIGYLFIGCLFIGLIILIKYIWNYSFSKGFTEGIEERKRKEAEDLANAGNSAAKIISEAEKIAENKKRELLIEAKEEIQKSRVEIEQEVRERRSELQQQEKRLIQKEEALEKKIESIEQKEVAIDKKTSEIEEKQQEVVRIEEQRLRELERISKLTEDDARAYLLNKVENEMKYETAMFIKDIETRAKLEAVSRARTIVANAIQKCAVDHTAQVTVSTVALPNDEMKGRIIGREGRNIRALETLTGVDIIIDDTPEAVVLSGFDPIRREIARIALEKLILDGRIHPARIEEMVEKAKEEVDEFIRQEGDRATFETGVNAIHPEIVRLLGRLKFRASYGQNVLNHSIEVSHLAGLMAEELGLDVALAKRAGLLHDIGKAVDHEIEGSHVTIGGDIAKKYGENDIIVNAILAHHGDVEPTSIVGVIVQAADSISAGRPGARKETLETYVKRLEKLEKIVTSFEGVEKCYAVQAGREIRIMVKPDEVSDIEMVIIARDIVKRIEDELDYPGQIKVNVIREIRTVEYAN